MHAREITRCEEHRLNLEDAMKKFLLFGMLAIVALPNLAHASRTCQFTAGPRAGRSFYFPLHMPITEAPVGAPCTDGMGSFGYAIPDQAAGQQPYQQSPQQYPQPQQYYPPAGQQQYPQPNPAPQGYQNGPAPQGLNREAQITAQCVARNGVTQAGAACIAASLTTIEINKCFSQGVGGSGCFGDNNTLRRLVADNLEAAQRERTMPGQAIRATTGVSVDAIQEKGILGGCNSDLRGLLGQKC